MNTTLNLEKIVKVNGKYLMKQNYNGKGWLNVPINYSKKILCLLIVCIYFIIILVKNL